jgi:hypothetical protein
MFCNGFLNGFGMLPVLLPATAESVGESNGLWWVYSPGRHSTYPKVGFEGKSNGFIRLLMVHTEDL